MGLNNEVLRSSVIRWIRTNGWNYPNVGTPFTAPFLTEEIGLDGANRFDVQRVYNILRIMLKDAQKHYIKNNGYFQGENKYENWDTFMHNLNANDIYVFISKYENKQRYYIQPSFQELEKLSYDRLRKQLKGLVTVVKEMVEYDEKLLTSGRPAAELLDATKTVDNVYLLNGKYEGKEVGVVSQSHHNCPFCTDRKFTSLAGLQRHMIYKHKLKRKRND